MDRMAFDLDRKGRKGHISFAGITLGFNWYKATNTENTVIMSVAGSGPYHLTLIARGTRLTAHLSPDQGTGWTWHVHVGTWDFAPVADAEHMDRLIEQARRIIEPAIGWVYSPELLHALGARLLLPLGVDGEAPIDVQPGSRVFHIPDAPTQDLAVPWRAPNGSCFLAVTWEERPPLGFLRTAGPGGVLLIPWEPSARVMQVIWAGMLTEDSSPLPDLLAAG
jgi:hypothetical protein